VQPCSTPRVTTLGPLTPRRQGQRTWSSERGSGRGLRLVRVFDVVVCVRIISVRIVEPVVLLAPADQRSELVELGDLPFGEWFGVVVVEVGVAVVFPAFEPPVEL